MKSQFFVLGVENLLVRRETYERLVEEQRAASKVAGGLISMSVVAGDALDEWLTHQQEVPPDEPKEHSTQHGGSV